MSLVLLVSWVVAPGSSGLDVLSREVRSSRPG